MNLRVLASLNWAIGCLALAGAVVYPFYYDVMLTRTKTAVAAAVDQIVQGERLRSFAPGSKFLYFRANQGEIMRKSLRVTLAGPAADFNYDASSDRDHVLVIRAVSSDAALRAGRVPPLLYTYAVTDARDLPDENGHAEGEWPTLSRLSVGLLSAIGM